MCHAKPVDGAQAATWKALVDRTLPSPDTWEVELSAGKDKREVFERLLREEKLGGLAVLRNLRNMEQAKVDPFLIRTRLSVGIKKALPFRFITAARHAPRYEDALEDAMFQGMAELPDFPGSTGLLVDVSGSMNDAISEKSETTRIDAACGLAILLRSKCRTCEIATFSTNLVVVPARRGFALRDAINNSQPHASTLLARALTMLGENPAWKGLSRIIVITDEQSADRPARPLWCPRAYCVNVAPNKNGLGYHDGWMHIDGWSERVIDYIREIETADRELMTGQLG
jgi:hypothetical protein